MNKKLISLLIAGSLVLGASANTNITIPDFIAGTNFGPGHTGGEDNETEPGTINTQAWDLEAFSISGTTLYIVGGYNMQAGEAGGGGSVVGGMLVPGDLFIKVGGLQPGALPTAPGSGPTMDNSADLYTHVVDLTNPVGATGPAEAFSLTSTSIFDTVIFDQFGANPWRYNSGGSSLGTIGMFYMSGLDDATASVYAGGLGVTGGLHNVLAVDLSFLGTVVAGTDVWFSYTMECGNDSMKGSYNGGFFQVPDGASSLLLISLGLSALTFFGLKRRQA